MLKLAPLFRILMLGLFLSVTQSLQAQPQEPEEPEVPITGIEVLIGLGGLLGAKKYYDLRKKNSKG